MTTAPPTPPTAASPPDASRDRKPERIPPSVGGSGLAIIAGLLFGRNIVEMMVQGLDVPLGAWAVPVVMLAFVVVLIQVALVARARMGVRVDPASVRRQWVVVGLAMAMGLCAGAALPFVQLG